MKHLQESARLQQEPVPGITAAVDEHNPRYFKVVIDGPGESPYEGGKFKVELFLPDEYPMAPPKVRFMTKLYHPNIDKLGRICLDILKGRIWNCLIICLTVYCFLLERKMESSSTNSYCSSINSSTFKCTQS